MENLNYIVKRDNIYVGLVSDTEKGKIKVMPDGIYEMDLSSELDKYHYFDNRKYLLTQKPQLQYGTGAFDANIFRSMLFVLDENNCANDLLYDSPHYPIFNISEIDLCLASFISIKNDAFNIGRLLEYFKYPEYLTYQEIIEIKEKFFGDFVLENSEIFGIYETDPHQTTVELYDMKGNHRTFNSWLKNGPLPTCNFIALSYTRSGWDLVENRVIDSFIPNEREESIKSLRKM